MTLHIAICSDAGLAENLPRLFWSIAQHHGDCDLQLHFGNTDPGPDALRPLVESLARRFGLSLTWYDLTGHLQEHIGAVDQPGRDAPLPAGTYARWFLPAVLDPSIKRLVYLDADTLVVGSLLAAADLDLAGAPFAAAADWSHAMDCEYDFAHKEHQRFLKRMRIDDFSTYVNAGVLIIDLIEWRSCDLTRQLLDLRADVISRGLPLTHEDQDVLNLWARGRMPLLDPSYNAMAFNIWQDPLFKCDCESLLKPLRVIHYPGKKPWVGDGWKKLPACLAIPLFEAIAAVDASQERAELFLRRAEVLKKLCSLNPSQFHQGYTQLVDRVMSAVGHGHVNDGMHANEFENACRQWCGMPDPMAAKYIPHMFHIRQCSLELLSQYPPMRALRKSWRLMRKYQLPVRYRLLHLLWMIRDTRSLG